MSEMASKRVSKKVKDLAREYEQRGYRVLLEPSKSEVPAFMKDMNYLPDLIAYGEPENLIVEVKSSRTVRDIRAWAPVADTIREHEGWEFVFVMTNPRQITKSETSGEQPNIDYARSYIKKADRLLALDKEGEFNEATFLLAWSGFESLVRYALVEVYKRKGEAVLSSLLRDSVMYGLVSKKDGQRLESLLDSRNRVAHGKSDRPISKKEITDLMRISKSVAGEL